VKPVGFGVGFIFCPSSIDIGGVRAGSALKAFFGTIVVRLSLPQVSEWVQMQRKEALPYAAWHGKGYPDSLTGPRFIRLHTISDIDHDTMKEFKAKNWMRVNGGGAVPLAKYTQSQMRERK